MEGSPALADMYTMMPIILLRPASRPAGERERDVRKVTHGSGGDCGVESPPEWAAFLGKLRQNPPHVPVASLDCTSGP